MIKSIRIELECDNCKAMAVTDGELPEGWSGHIPPVLPNFGLSFVFSSTDTEQAPSPLRRPLYCAACMSAAAQARDAALAARQP